VMKNILDGRKDGWKDGQTDRGKTIYPPPPLGSGGIGMDGRTDRDKTVYPV
jgi:hypothetical protein